MYASWKALSPRGQKFGIQILPQTPISLSIKDYDNTCLCVLHNVFVRFNEITNWEEIVKCEHFRHVMCCHY